MVLRALPYVLIWLNAMLLFIDATPHRAMTALCGVGAAVAARILAPRVAVSAPLLVAAVVTSVALALDVPSSAGLGRALAATLFGTLAMYCLARAVRG